MCLVIWNPWLEKAAVMSDFEAEEYLNMICVEAGHVSKPYHLAPGEHTTFSQTLQVFGTD